MSWKRISAALKVRGLSFADSIMLVRLANHENETTGQCNPSLSTLAKECGCTRRHAIRIIQNLCNRGLVLKTTSVNSSTSYMFGGDMCVTTYQNGGDTEVTTEHKGGDTEVTTKERCGDTGVTTVVTSASPVVVTPVSPKSINKNLEEKPFTTTTTTTTKPSPPPQPTGGGGDAPAADFDDDAFEDWMCELQRDAERIHGPIGEELRDLNLKGKWFFVGKVEEKTPEFAHGHEHEIFDVLNAVYRNHGLDDTGAPIEDLISFLCDLVLGKRACFGIKIDHPLESENAQEAASTPSEPSERVSAPPAAEERATADPTRQICETAKPHQPKDSEKPTFADIRDRLDAKFGDTYDRAAVLAAYDKLSEAGWKDANGQPIRDPFRYLAAIATAKQMPANAELEPYPDDETVRLWVEEDCQNGYCDLAAAFAARDRLFADQTLRKSLRCGIRAYIVGAARRADAQATVRLAAG